MFYKIIVIFSFICVYVKIYSIKQESFDLVAFNGRFLIHYSLLGAVAVGEAPLVLVRM
jgi:hypothetical protein